MSRKIPAEAFSYYFSLGTDRSYKAVAEKYDCSERAVAKVAGKDDWQGRLEELESKARAKSEQQLLETLEEMNLRHVKTARMLQARGIEALKAMKIESIPDALKAVQVGLDKERLIRGEPSDRTAINVEEVIKREYQNWMVRDDDDLEDEPVP